MEQYILTNSQARRFILLKQGLIGAYKFIGKDGVSDFIKQAGCVQYDPIDICGKNAELVLQSRVKGFTKQMLYDLLYTYRKLVDYFDKNLAIIGVDDWKYFEPIRESNRKYGRGHDEVDVVAEKIINIIKEKGPVCSKDFDLGQKVDWYWSNNTSLSRVALETMYFRGDLIIHHKKGTIKYYALTKDYIPQNILSAEDPNKEELEYMKWRVLRRISAVGLMWNKPSDAWIYIKDLKSEERKHVFEELIIENKIIELTIENINEKFYCIASDKKLIEEVLKNPIFKERTELIAPLDSMLWDRKLIKAIFEYQYKWEIYTPQVERKYGYYVLPILSGERLIGRVEIVNEKKNKCLVIENIWLEDGIRQTKKLSADLDRCFNRFAKFNGCDDIKRNEHLY